MVAATFFGAAGSLVVPVVVLMDCARTPLFFGAKRGICAFPFCHEGIAGLARFLDELGDYGLLRILRLRP
jgi:hypothetical protein